MDETQEKFLKYLDLQKKLVESRKQQRQLKEESHILEKEIREYMTKNDMDSISLKEGEIVLYAKKISQTFKRDTIVEKLTKSLQCDESKAEALADNLIKNKTFVLEDKVKAIIKKKKKKVEGMLQHCQRWLPNLQTETYYKSSSKSSSPKL